MLEHWHPFCPTTLMMLLEATFVVETVAHEAVVVGTVAWQPMPCILAHHVHVRTPLFESAHCCFALPYPGKLQLLR
jgi:hypothetical protein